MKKLLLILSLFSASLVFADGIDTPTYTFGDANTTPGVTVKRARGHPGDKEHIYSGDILVGLYGYGYGLSDYSSGARSSIELQAAENWTNSAHGSKILFKTTPAGSVTPATVLTIGSDGSLTGAVAATSFSSVTVNGYLKVDVNAGNKPTFYVESAGNQVGISTAAVAAGYRVGIDLTGMSSLFDINNVAATGFLWNASPIANDIDFQAGFSAEPGSFIGNGTSDIFSIKTGNTTRMIVGTNGGVSIGTATFNDAGNLFYPNRRTTTQINAITPAGAGGMVYNSTLNELCVSTGTGLGAFVNVKDYTTACQ